MVNKITFLSFIVMLAAAFSMNAQVTTSAMSGLVTDEKNEALIGATVHATHTPSGTKYNAVSNLDGRFTIQGMRTGGPYTVEVSYIGYKNRVIEGLVLELGETTNVPVQMTNDATALGEIVVTAVGTKFTAEKTGASTNINNSMIANLPTVSRSLTDLTRLSPYGGNGMSIAGGDGRMTNFTVDGSNFNNDFGLSDALPGGGNPISIDAIEEMQIVVSDFDVRQTNFIGGGVNAITKSGTNTFKGSVYFHHRNENMRGDAIDRVQLLNVRDKDQNTVWGATLGGPIIKDKLFFFVNAELTKIPTVVNRWRASEDGVGDESRYISRTLASDMQRVSDHVAWKYGYDTGSWTDFPANESNKKLLAKIDWNITDAHHLTLRYNFTDNMYWQNPNASSMDGGTRSNYSRVSMYSMSFANSLYSMNNRVHSLALELNSRINDNLSNNFRLTFDKKDDVRGSNSEEFPFIDILDGSGDINNYMALGYELFTWNNAVHNTVWQAQDNVTYYLGKHKILAGLSYEHQMADNQYMRNGTGYYRYNSVDDFINGATPEVVCLTYGYNGEKNPAARVRFNKLGLYVQDEFNPTERFKLNLGIRFDGLFFNNSDLMTNNAILEQTYWDSKGNERHIDTGKWPSSKITVSPRVGFTWDIMGDKSLRMRGGTGMFMGRSPLVFFTNMPTNGGLVQYQAQLSSKKNYDMTKFNGGLVCDANGKPTIEALRQFLVNNFGMPTEVKPEDGTLPATISAVSPKFKMPQVWKTSVALDYNIPVKFPFTVTVEGTFEKNINAACISDWSIPSVGGFARFNGVDNRPVYPAGFRTGTAAFVLENTSKGYSWIANVNLTAKPADWVTLTASYTHTVRKEITGMPGSAAESAFTYVPTYEGPNNIKLHNSQYVTPDRVFATATLHDKWANHYSFIYEAWRGGYSYSYMTVNDMNGDGYNYDAIYIPTDAEVADGSFRFVSQDDAERFMAYVHNNSYLKKNQGKYAEGYSLYSPWVHRLDFKYEHDFKFKIGSTKHMFKVSFDIKNVLNLFNSSWGVSKGLNSEIGSDARILKYEGVDAQGYATFSTPEAINGNTKTFVPIHAIGQCWNAAIGIKYIFN
ncbi:MAG: TonB-dependent receptor [Muribaculaceae bacterium]|nr:TonB-dependent receptor [Muribaculaceae bacterium]